MSPIQRKLFGEILNENNIASKSQIGEALEIQKQTGGKIGEILAGKGYITEIDIARTLATQLNLPYIDASKIESIDSKIKKIIPEQIVKDNLIIPYEKEGNTFRVIMADPTNIYVIDDIKMITGFPKIDIFISAKSSVKNAITQLYDITGTMEEILENIDEDGVELVDTSSKGASVAELKEQTEETPIIKMVNLIIMEALRSKATDIHIEPYENTFRVRYRIDGVLYEVTPPPKRFQAAITSRIKIMADLDIAERRQPQDGRFKVRMSDREIDFRVSTLPTAFGEKVVLRILDKSGMTVELDKLGMDSRELNIFKETIKEPHGMILVTGPTGSGKTTTLYSALNILNTPDQNIVTVEDPVEYILSGINQVPTRAQIGLTFAAGLRSILRQDPDIIMIGEIRDQETAEIAINSALTGHLVFSTLHTNDSVGAIVRLDNMGIEPFLITSSLHMVVAQRLMRKICENCKEEYEPTEELLNAIGIRELNNNIKLTRGKGCDDCSGTGYRGRIGIYEILRVSEELKRLIVQRASSSELKEQSVKEGMVTLRHSALKKVKDGISTVEELWRVTTADVAEGG